MGSSLGPSLFLGMDCLLQKDGISSPMKCLPLQARARDLRESLPIHRFGLHECDANPTLSIARREREIISSCFSMMSAHSRPSPAFRASLVEFARDLDTARWPLLWHPGRALEPFVVPRRRARHPANPPRRTPSYLASPSSSAITLLLENFLLESAENSMAGVSPMNRFSRNLFENFIRRLARHVFRKTERFAPDGIARRCGPSSTSGSRRNSVSRISPAASAGRCRTCALSSSASSDSRSFNTSSRSG